MALTENYNGFDRLNSFMNFIDDRDLCAVIMMIPQTGSVIISIKQYQLNAPILFSGTGKDIGGALDDLIGTFQKVGYL